MTRRGILYPAAAEGGRRLAQRWRGQRPRFVCVLAHTDTCLIPDISAAGLTEELRPRTPAADAEVVLRGEARCLPQLPSNPLGAPGPAGITRAALSTIDTRAVFLGVGLRVWPDAECMRVGAASGGDIRLGRAVPEAHTLFERGLALGGELSQGAPYVVIAESVPGGTTTALALLLALGYSAAGRISGSMRGNAHTLKLQVATTALDAASLAFGTGRGDPLGTVAAVGDPMQPLVAGMTLGAVRAGHDVLLAGGSQMIAVAALIEALAGRTALDRVAIGTTRWVALDPNADVAGLAREVSPELAVLAADLDFSQSRHAGLRAYEHFLVKEGVGAGGACIAALLGTGTPVEQLEARIDAVYDDLLGRLLVAPA